MTNTGLSDDFSLDTLLSASLLGIFLALSIAESIIPDLSSLESNKSFNSENRFSLSSLNVQILTILRAREYGIFCVTCVG